MGRKNRRGRGRGGGGQRHNNQNNTRGGGQQNNKLKWEYVTKNGKVNTFVKPWQKNQNQNGNQGNRPNHPQAGTTGKRRGKKNKGNKWHKQNQGKNPNRNKWNSKKGQEKNTGQENHNSNQPFRCNPWNDPLRPIHHTEYTTSNQSLGWPVDPVFHRQWWSHPFSPDFPFNLRGRFDTSNDPPRNPFLNSTPKRQQHQYRLPLEIEFENLIGWQDVTHDYISKDNPTSESACSICVALAQQLLIVKTGLAGAPEFSYDLDMKSPGLIEPEIMNKFLEQVVGAVRTKDGEQLCSILQIEPPFTLPYEQLIQDLRRRYPAGNDERLEGICENTMKGLLEELDLTWGAFPLFLRDYFRFIRDVDITNLVITHAQLMALLKQCNYALGDSTMGVVVLPTALQYSKLLTRLTIGLDNRPELIVELRRQSLESGTAGDEENKSSLVEDSANVIRDAFSKCLNDRSGGGGGRTSKPEGKRVGIYVTANMCLKLFIQCKKLDNAQQMFTSISQLAPPLSLYPKAQRVTYLYYLGRYMFANSHFYRALLTLQEAYAQCHSSLTKHRRLILIYLIASNMILGRSPSAFLLSRMEAEGLISIFGPIQNAISKGDIYQFRLLTSLDGDSPIAEWLLRKRMLLQIRNRCELLVWRSLARKIFMISGFHGDGAGSKKMPNFQLADLLAVATMLENKAVEPDATLQPISSNSAKPKTPMSGLMLDPMSMKSPDTPTSPAREGPVLYNGYVAPEFEAIDCWEPYTPAPDLPEVESILTSLIDQRLIQGSMYRGEKLEAFRVGIPGSKGTLKGALRAGWPNVWKTLKAKAEEDGEEVPGWVRAPNEVGGGGVSNGMGVFGGGAGSVLNLSGARPVGS